MEPKLRRKVVAGSVAAAAVLGGGAAIAATQLGSPKEESQAIVNDAAKQLGVQPSALSNALKKALENRVDAAVSAGQITRAQGDALKQRIEAGDVPLLGIPFGTREHHFFGPHLDAAAKYLGLSESELESRLESGKTLAQVAKDEGKSVSGLIDALVADEKSELDEAVSDGRMTKAQEQQLLANAKQRFTDLVNGKVPDHGPGPGGPGFFFRGGPPPNGAAPGI